MQHFQCWCYSYPTSTCLTTKVTSVLTHFIKNKKLISELERKLKWILYFEDSTPNYFRQHITDLKNKLSNIG